MNVVLIRTKYSGNIGMASRAMANMGVNRLILINPQCQIDSRAREQAAGGQGPLKHCQIYSSWSEFYSIEGEGLRIGLSCRDRTLGETTPLDSVLKENMTKSDIVKNDTAEKDAVANSHQGFHYFNQPVYLFFGPEDHGLSADDAANFHHLCHLPTYGFTSMNIAQAVLLSLYIAQRQPAQFQEDHPPIKQDLTKSIYRRQPMFFPEKTLKSWLTLLGFDLNARKVNVYHILKKMILKNQPSSKELQIFESVVQQTIRKLKTDSLPQESCPDVGIDQLKPSYGRGSKFT